MSIVVTIDGPAASGKTSVSRELGRRLGWKWVSTGSFYRGLAYVAQQLSVPLTEESSLAELAASERWRVQMDPDNTKVFFDGRDVTDDLNAEAVGGAASLVSQFPKVRQKLLPLQRACWTSSHNLIAEGRDCGSIVFPQAKVKIYLTARSQDRAQRRAKDQGASVDSVQAAQAIRDHQDQKRSVAPLQVAQESHVIDTSDMTLGEVVDSIEKIVREAIR